MDTDERILLTLMRHGRSRADDEIVHEGRYDSPLTDVGRQQAQARARDLLAQGMTFDCIIASPLARAHETAQIIAEVLHVPLEVDADWMELDNGPLAGLSPDVAAVRYPKPDFRNPYEPFCGSGESEWEIHCRAARALGKVVRRGAGCYLVVAHGGILNAALRTIVGATPAPYGQGIAFAFGDTSYAQLAYFPCRHRWVLLSLNPRL